VVAVVDSALARSLLAALGVAMPSFPVHVFDLGTRTSTASSG
jgi:hypothetical protein